MAMNAKQIIIDFMRKNRFMYDNSLDAYYDTKLRESKWQELAENTELKVSAVKSKWKYIKEQFYKQEHLKIPMKVESKKVKLNDMEKLHFLKDVRRRKMLSEREMSSNINELLIKFMQHNPFMYFKKSPEYKNKTLKEQKWQQLADENGIEVTRLKVKWKMLRDRFNRLYVGKGNRVPNIWKYYDRLQFLTCNYTGQEPQMMPEVEEQEVIVEEQQKSEPNIFNEIFETAGDPGNDPLTEAQQGLQQHQGAKAEEFTIEDHAMEEQITYTEQQQQQHQQHQQQQQTQHHQAQQHPHQGQQQQQAQQSQEQQMQHFQNTISEENIIETSFHVPQFEVKTNPTLHQDSQFKTRTKYDTFFQSIALMVEEANLPLESFIALQVDILDIIREHIFKVQSNLQTL